MPMIAIKTYIGRVKGENGFSPIVEVYENTSASYRLRITDKTHTFLTPNLHGVTFKSAIVEVLGHEPLLSLFQIWASILSLRRIHLITYR
jgi:hypothetical protein